MLKSRRTPDAQARQLWLRQLATLLQAGIALHPALQLLVQQQVADCRDYWQQVNTDIEQGHSLSATLARRPGFMPGDIALLRMAEQAGRLDLQIARLADLQARRLALRAQLLRTARYPALVLAGALLVSGFLLTQVVPGFASLYDSFGAELPWLTRLMLDLSAILQRIWPALLGLLLGSAIAGTIAWQRQPSWRRHVYRQLWRLPLLGPITRLAWLAQWHRGLHESLHAGLPFVTALALSAALVSESPLADSQQDLQAAVESGRRLSEALRQCRHYPPLCGQMIAIGEESGMLVSLLQTLAAQFEDELECRCGQALKLLEPLLMAGLGLLVGIIVMALYLPLFQLGQVI